MALPRRSQMNLGEGAFRSPPFSAAENRLTTGNMFIAKQFSIKAIAPDQENS